MGPRGPGTLEEAPKETEGEGDGSETAGFGGKTTGEESADFMPRKSYNIGFTWSGVTLFWFVLVC